MDRFSVRNNLHHLTNQNDCSRSTRTRIWQVFAKKHVWGYSERKVYYDVVEEILSYFGFEYYMKTSPFDHEKNINMLSHFIINDSEWYNVYDFIELFIDYCKSLEESESREVIQEFNKILSDEKTGYHIIDGLVIAITNEQEVSTIETTLSSCPAHVAASVKKALRLFSDKVSPDYNN